VELAERRSSACLGLGRAQCIAMPRSGALDVLIPPLTAVFRQPAIALGGINMLKIPILPISMETQDPSGDYQSFALHAFEGLPHDACMHVDRPGAFAPELALCRALDYHEVKHEQVAAAEALGRCRRRTAELAAAAESAADALVRAEERVRRQWRWVDDSAPNCNLPPSCPRRLDECGARAAHGVAARWPRSHELDHASISSGPGDAG